MHHLEVVLVITSPDLTKPGNSRFLLIKRADGTQQLPTATVSITQSTIEVAAGLLERLTGLKARILGVGWVDLIPMPLVDSVDRMIRFEDSYDGEDRSLERRVIGVPYVAMLPGEVVKLSNPDSSWVPLFETFEMQLYLDHGAILQGACHRV